MTVYTVNSEGTELTDECKYERMLHDINATYIGCTKILYTLGLYDTLSLQHQGFYNETDTIFHTVGSRTVLLEYRKWHRIKNADIEVTHTGNSMIPFLNHFFNPTTIMPTTPTKSFPRPVAQ